MVFGRENFPNFLKADQELLRKTDPFINSYRKKYVILFE